MKTTIYCILLCLIGIYATCNKRIDCKQNVYSFEAFFKAYPDFDSVQVGDTIWLELNSPTRATDLATNTTTDYSGAENFGTAISYLQIIGGDVTDPGATPSANSFDNVLINGSTVQSSIYLEKIREFLFEEKAGNYEFKIGIVPKKKGLFMLAPGDAAGVYRSSNKCDKASFSLTFKDTDQHLYLYEQKRPGYLLSHYDKGHLYAFKVY